MTDDLTDEQLQEQKLARDIVFQLKSKFPNRKIALVRYNRIAIDLVYLHYKECGKLLNGERSLEDVIANFKRVNVS